MRRRVTRPCTAERSSHQLIPSPAPSAPSTTFTPRRPRPTPPTPRSWRPPPGEGDKPARQIADIFRQHLQRIFLFDPIKAWTPAFARLKRLSHSPKHHLVDPALAARLVGASARPGCCVVRAAASTLPPAPGWGHCSSRWPPNRYGSTPKRPMPEAVGEASSGTWLLRDQRRRGSGHQGGPRLASAVHPPNTPGGTGGPRTMTARRSAAWRARGGNRMQASFLVERRLPT